MIYGILIGLIVSSTVIYLANVSGHPGTNLICSWVRIACLTVFTTCVGAGIGLYLQGGNICG